MSSTNYKKYLFIFLLLNSITLSISIINAQSNNLKVGLLTDEALINAEFIEAQNYLELNSDFECKVISFGEIISNESVLKDIEVIWFHRPDSSALTSNEINESVIERISDYIKGGGSLLLTLDAFIYISLLKVESNTPEVRYKESKDEGYGRMLGFHAFRGHPIFKDLHGGAYVFKPTKDTTVRQFGYFDNDLPNEGKVVAVDWDYIFLREEKKILLEYELGRGKILAVGGYTCFKPENVNRQHLELFIQNCVNYLGNKLGEETEYYWNFEKCKIIGFESNQDSLVPVKSKKWNNYNDSMTLTSAFAGDNFYDVAGQRIVIMGKETGGIDEIWTHPFMALRDYEVGIKFSNQDTIIWFNEQRPKIEVRPESFTRIYKFKRAYVTEIITTDIKDPVGVVHYEYRGVYPAKLIIKLKSNFRYMWPYSERVLGSLYYSWDKGLNALVLKDGSEDFSCIVGYNKKPENMHIGKFSDFNWEDSLWIDVDTEEFFVGALLEFNLEMNDNMDVVISASNQNYNESLEIYKDAINDPLKIYKDTKKYVTKFLDSSLMITSQDETFNIGYKWSLIGSDRFFVHTPGLGKSLVAGYSTTVTGWDGGHNVNGRPGYAWFFGRDAEWSGFAVLDYGDFDKVKSVLQFFQNYQDLNGKIFHELSTSGLVHYDASDATPLYLILAGYYLRHSGDIEFIKESWSHIKTAIDFCFSTDTDDDHLIENTNVGHGWVEGGSLFGSHSSLYLTACWAEALNEVSYIAKALGDEKLSEFYKNESEAVTNIINTDFWDKDSNFFYHGKFIDGTYHNELTILPTIPLYFELINKDKTSSLLSKYASNEFTSDWGVRIVSEQSPLFKPYGYHTGSVWPLFTGWTALAEFNYGNYLQGFSHVMNNLNIYKYWALGFVEEVLNGIEYNPAGVCRHQCWSQTMVLQPIIEGMLGLKKDAINNILEFSPRFPADWDTVRVENIKIGNRSVSVAMDRKTDLTIYKFTLTGGNSIFIDFKPAFPNATEIMNVLDNGTELDYSVSQTKQAVVLKMNLTISKENVLRIKHKNGISILPIISDPKPGYASNGLRIINSQLIEDLYFIELESQSGRTEVINIYSIKDITNSISNGKVLNKMGNIYSVEVQFAQSENKYSREQLIIKLED
ncbi:amylo-alpha-1,6-glucosidase [Bacteroidota bacterium]